MNNEAYSSVREEQTLSLALRTKTLIYHVIKRVFDIFCAIIGIVALLPLSIIVKISYLLSGDTKSIFYSHTRVGKNGEEFLLYKFRTMVPNSKEMLEEMLKDPKYKKEWDENQKITNDPRITKIGKLLRKTSLDEMPQFINVLVGDMSLIGPRPLVPGELDSHNGNHEIYEKVRPGITSWCETTLYVENRVLNLCRGGA